MNELAARYPLFAVQMALNDSAPNGGCADCRIIGQRLDIRGRQNSAELKEMLLQGKVFEHLFARELLIESPSGVKAMPEQTPDQVCR